jgi:hypothetical protein
MTKYVSDRLEISEETLEALSKEARGKAVELLWAAREAEEKARWAKQKVERFINETLVLQNDPHAWDWNYSTASLRGC